MQRLNLKWFNCSCCIDTRHCKLCYSLVIISGGSRGKCCHNQSRTQRHRDVNDRLLWICCLLVNRSDPVLSPLHWIQDRSYSLVLPLHQCYCDINSLSTASVLIIFTVFKYIFFCVSNFTSFTGSTSSLTCWSLPTAASILSSTPPPTVSSRAASDV